MMIADTEQVNRWSHSRAQLLHLRESAPYIHLCNVKDSSAHYELEYDRWQARVSKEGESYAVDCCDSLTMAGVCGSSEHEAVNQNLIFGSELA